MANRKNAKPTPRKAVKKSPKGLVAPTRAVAAVQPSAPSSMDLTGFFRAVGEGFVDAQLAMDQKSKEYLNAIRDSPFLPPSVFRIPKVTASVKVAMDVKQQSNVNLLFYTDENVAQTLNQQTVEFEVVAAPAAPGSVPMPPLAFGYVASPVTRRRIADALPPELAGNADRVIAISDNSVDRFYLLYAEAGPPVKFGFWHLSLEGAPVLAVLREFGPAQGDALSALALALAAQADSQQRFLVNPA